ncbi:MAG: tetratricopeptide repeat protein [Verrucomicrobiota bacterium]
MFWDDRPQARRILLILVVVAVFAVCAFSFGWVRDIRTGLAIRAARQHIAANDARSAALSIQRVLDLNPNHVEALRLKGNLLNVFKDPEAIEAWTRVAELTNDRTNWCTALAVAVQMGRPDLGARAAAHIDQHYRSDSDALRLLVAHSLLKNDLPRARILLEQLGTLDKTNLWDQFNRATLTLADTNSPRHAWAEGELKRLSTNETVAAPSLRMLIDRRAARQDYTAAAAYSEQLIRVPGSLWSDRFDHVRRQWQADPTQGRQSLEELLMRPMGDELLLQLARRLVDWGYWDAAQTVVARIPEPARFSIRVVSVQVEVLARGNKWRELDEFLSRPGIPTHEPLLELYRALASRQIGRERLAKEQLEYARILSRLKPEVQSSLADRLDAWGWHEEANLFRWQQAQENRNPLPALRTLAKYYYDRGDTANMARALERWLVVEPASVTVKNNLALILLLLERDADRAHQLAREAADASPKNDAVRSTYAYSLFKQGKTSEARDEFAKIAAPSPSMQLYHALILSAAGETNRVRELLAQADKARLFPEEQKLLRQLHEQFP